VNTNKVREEAGLEDQGKILTLKAVKNKFLDKDKNSRTILILSKKHNEECEQKIGVLITRATYGRYETCYKHVREFIKKEYKAEDLPISDINKRFYERLEFYLKKDKMCCHNTSLKYICNFNKITRMAVESGWLVKSSYRDIGYRLEEVDKPYLTKEELKSIEEKEISIKRLSIIRDMFPFGCYTGLAFSDIKELTEDNIQIGIDGNLCK
jgi:hypothetical protein